MYGRKFFRIQFHDSRRYVENRCDKKNSGVIIILQRKSYVTRIEYVLIKEYNPAYGFFIFRFFKENGIKVDQKITLREAEGVALAFQNKEQEARGKEPTKFLVWGGWGNDLATPEKLFWDFVHYWSNGPWHRPTNLSFFERIFAGNRLPGYNRLKELEVEVASNDKQSNKLLFTTDEAATDIVAFYTKHIIDPLRKELAGGRSRRRLLKYLSFNEMRRIPDVRLVGTEKHDKVIERMALEVLNWLGAVTEDEVAREICQSPRGALDACRERPYEAQHRDEVSSLSPPVRLCADFRFPFGRWPGDRECAHSARTRVPHLGEA